MKLRFILLLVALPLLSPGQQGQADTTPSAGVAVTKAPEGSDKTEPSIYHAGPWEQQIGYSQALRVGNTIYVSGTTGADENGGTSDFQSQMKLAYEGIRKTLAHYGADLTNVVMERIHTTDMDALIQARIPSSFGPGYGAVTLNTTPPTPWPPEDVVP